VGDQGIYNALLTPNFIKTIRVIDKDCCLRWGQLSSAFGDWEDGSWGKGGDPSMLTSLHFTNMPQKDKLACLSDYYQIDAKEAIGSCIAKRPMNK